MAITRKASSFQAYKSYQQITRTLFGLCIVLGLLCLSLGATIIGILPLKEVRPMLIAVSDESKKVIRIEPIKENIQGINLLTEKLVMHYVKQRETIDGITESSRYQEISNMTSKRVWDDYWNFVKLENPKSPLKTFFDNGIRREVHVKNCLSLHATASNTYRVEWTSIDTKHGDEIKKQKWISTLAVSFEPQNVRVKDQYINPLGLKIIHYTVSKKEDD